MGQRIAGIAFIKADGVQLEVKGGIEIPFSAVSRETVMSLAGNAGYKEIANRQFIKITAVFTRDFPIAKLSTMTNGTVTAELANGKVYTLTGAYLEGETTTNGEDGETELEFSGVSGIWR